MKTLKQRFTQWFNGRHQRRGTLWEERFKSTLVEGRALALKTMAAYIELNPVRANICEDPKDYRWSSYTEALSGNKKAETTLKWLNSLTSSSQAEGDAQQQERLAFSMQEVFRCWRCYLFGLPESETSQQLEQEKEKSGGEADIFRKRLSRQKALSALKKGGRLSQADYLRCRLRYFSEGVALGSKKFVEDTFKDSKNHFHPQRKNGSRSLRGLELKPKKERLYNMRQLGKDAIT